MNHPENHVETVELMAREDAEKKKSLARSMDHASSSAAEKKQRTGKASPVLKAAEAAVDVDGEAELTGGAQEGVVRPTQAPEYQDVRIKSGGYMSHLRAAASADAPKGGAELERGGRREASQRNPSTPVAAPPADGRAAPPSPSSKRAVTPPATPKRKPTPPPFPPKGKGQK